MIRKRNGKRVLAFMMIGFVTTTLLPGTTYASSMSGNSEIMTNTDLIREPDTEQEAPEKTNSLTIEKETSDNSSRKEDVRWELNRQLNKVKALDLEDNPTPPGENDPKEEGKTEITTSIAYAIGDNKPIERTEIFQDNKEKTKVFYLKNDAMISIKVKDINFEGAQLNVGVRYNGGDIEWKITNLSSSEDVIRQKLEKEGQYEVFAWVKEANGAVIGKDVQTGIVEEAYISRIVIDKKQPKLAFSGVKERQAFNKAAEISLSADDANHDWEKYKLSIVFRDTSGMEFSETRILKEKDWKQDKTKANYNTSFTKEGQYELTVEGVDKAGNAAEKQTLHFTIDKTPPVITDVVYYNDIGYITQKYENIYSDHLIVVEMVIHDKLVGVDDSQVYVTIGSDKDFSNTKTFPARRLPGDRYSVFVPKDIGVEELNDKIIVWASDRVGNKAYYTSYKLVVSGSKPNIEMLYDEDPNEWTNQDFRINTKVEDSVAGLQEIVYKVNGKKVKKVQFQSMTTSYPYFLVAKEGASSSAGYRVTIEATNNCGNRRIVNKTVYIDKEKPKVTLSGVENGGFYKSNQNIHVEVSDDISKETETTFHVERELDGKKTSVELKDFYTKQKKDSCDRTISEDGKYTVYAYTTDKAGNDTKSNVLEFTIDKTPPKLSITGVTNGQKSNESVDVTFSCEESFYDTNEVQIEIERTVNGKPSTEKIDKLDSKGKVSTTRKHFGEDGVYRLRMTARDKAGNVADTAEITFTIDQSKPVVRIMGSDNYELWGKAVSLQYSIEENFYKNIEISLTGTKTDIDGKVTELKMPEFKGDTAVSTLSQTFNDEGVYTVKIEAKDQVGNQDSAEIHFTVDYSNPVINGIKEYDGGYFQEFKIGDSLDDLFKDLTVLSYHILLNGIEYDGTSTITKEGKYTLDVEATDELNHKSNEVVEFMIDRTEPKVIFNGVKNGESVREKGKITFALTEDEDMITCVRMNGVEYGADVRELEYTKYGDYLVEIDCTDKAGNNATKQLEFTYDNPNKGKVFGGVGAGLLIVCAAIFIFISRKRKEVK